MKIRPFLEPILSLQVRSLDLVDFVLQLIIISAQLFHVFRVLIRHVLIALLIRVYLCNYQSKALKVEKLLGNVLVRIRRVLNQVSHPDFWVRYRKIIKLHRVMAFRQQQSRFVHPQEDG